VPWVRLDEHALNHVKLLALSDGAFRLWVEGLAHCQKHLTDGTISSDVLRGFRYARPSRIIELTRSVESAAPLWSPVPGGFEVHDYLAWNDDKATVMRKRERARDRMQRLRGSNGGSHEHQSEHPSARTANVRGTTTTTTTTGTGRGSPNVRALSES
jgi:hypothetical protein